MSHVHGIRLEDGIGKIGKTLVHDKRNILLVCHIGEIAEDVRLVVVDGV